MRTVGSWWELGVIHSTGVLRLPQASSTDGFTPSCLSVAAFFISIFASSENGSLSRFFTSKVKLLWQITTAEKSVLFSTCGGGNLHCELNQRAQNECKLQSLINGLTWSITNKQVQESSNPAHWKEQRLRRTLQDYFMTDEAAMGNRLCLLVSFRGLFHWKDSGQTFMPHKD